jgi:transketolase
MQSKQMNVAENYGLLVDYARRGRWLVLSTVAAAGAGHVGGPLSAMDLLIALYFRVMNIRPDEPAWDGRDRFILSKGHSAIGQYTVMALRGFFPVEELKTFDQGNSRLQGHPDCTELPGLDTSTGSLGQGLSAGVGMALGAKLRHLNNHTFVVLGDGELQEGMVWEAIHVAPRYGLGNLTAILDWNGLQQVGWKSRIGEERRGDHRDPWAGISLSSVFKELGWRTVEIDGHDFSQIVPVLEEAKKAPSPDRPTMVLARTVKGKGLSFAEGKAAWHSKFANERELAAARVELGLEASR